MKNNFFAIDSEKDVSLKFKFDFEFAFELKKNRDFKKRWKETTNKFFHKKVFLFCYIPVIQCLRGILMYRSCVSIRKVYYLSKSIFLWRKVYKNSLKMSLRAKHLMRETLKKMHF